LEPRWGLIPPNPPPGDGIDSRYERERNLLNGSAIIFLEVKLISIC